MNTRERWPEPDERALRAFVAAHPDATIDPDIARRREEGEPLAYITGFAGFYGREFAVTPDVLIPRPETEHLVEDAVAFLRDTKRTNVLDVGTGSGAIACSIAAEVPAAFVDATDVSAAALAVAKGNAARLGLADRCTFALADIVNDYSKRYDLIVANLPYIPSADVPAKPDAVGFEPRAATDGGPDGLEQYRKLLAAAPGLAAPGALILLEAAPPTMAALRALAEAAFPAAAVRVCRDYAGLDRYVRIAAR
ncbi:MAG TPA: peptide chain release factor N(5)-glutamine methyltransferase [Candidatus Rubrimentiphilum sp.]|nr:peptide chain release factor N(5)-glutamine methyltransferase [Candidatus Rubrimentiphilum sp.]